MAIKTVVINKGLRGNSVLNGTTVPSVTIGINGDFYIDTVALKIYGPKASGLWGSGTSLGGGGGSGANTALSNLVSTAVNVPLNDSGGVASLDLTARTLKDAAGQNAMRWNFRQLDDSSNSGSLEWDNRLLLDNSGNIAANWGIRSLVNTAGVSVLTWAALTAGAAGQFLQTDGAGNVIWADAAGAGNETLVFAATNNQSSPADVTGMILDPDVQNYYYINITANFTTSGPGAVDSNVAAVALAAYLPEEDTWTINIPGQPNVIAGPTDPGFTLTITPLGQIQYTTGDVTNGGSTGTAVDSYNLTFLITDPGGISSSSGANKALSNLTATALNQDLNPSANLVRAIGADALRFTSVHAAQFGDYSAPVSFVSGGTMTIDASGSMNISSSGAGVVLGSLGDNGVTLYSMDASQGPQLNFNDGTNTKQVRLKAPNALTNGYQLVWPLDQGTNNQTLVNDGSGNLSWASGGGGGSPGGPDRAIQFAAMGSFAGDANFLWTSDQLQLINEGTAPASAASYAIGIKNNGDYALTLGGDNTATYIQAWNNKPLWINQFGNNVGIGTGLAAIDEMLVVGGNIKTGNSVFAGDFRSANDAYFLSRNAADNAYISLIKADSSNQVIVGDASQVIRNLTSRFDVISNSQVNFYAGNAQVNILPNGAGAPAVRWHDDDASNFIGFKAPSVVPANFIYTWPAIDAAGALTSDGGGNLSWDGPNGGKVFIAAQTGFSAAPTQVTFTTADQEFDTGSVIGTNQMVIQKAGYYTLVGSAYSPTNVTTDFILMYYSINGGPQIQFSAISFGDTSSYASGFGAAQLKLNASDTVQMFIFATQGEADNIAFSLLKH